MKNRLLLLSLLTLVNINLSQAETTNFGGYNERYKGGGDKIPPSCTVDIPKASTEPFFIKWYCVDDNSTPEQLRTELWMYKKGSEAGELVKNFLGFPASVQIDEGLLGVTTFTDGLPVSFKLLAKDSAGITTISPIITVSAQDISLSTCDVTIKTAAVESTTESTGTPELEVFINDAKVNVVESQDKKIVVSTSGKAHADTCQIESICSNDDFITFTTSVSGQNTEDTTTGTATFAPGNVSAKLSGTSSFNSLSLEELDLKGETTIDGTAATVTLNCSK
ncbi:MAG: hypothetical protein KBC84_02420 [Proteobacteria bacterium]|nr:hypothetical protein [Pseudomonadota bacterium]